MNRALAVVALSICCFARTSVVAAPAPEPESSHLKFAVVLTRHGVRSPTAANEELNRYSTAPWPDWDVPPGYLTAHGRTLMTIFGAWYRQYFAQQHLLLADGCAASAQVLFRADIDQRTRETAGALAKGFFSGCQVEVDVLPNGKADPLFHPLRAGIVQADTRQATTAVLDRIGGSPETLVGAYDHPFESLREVLLGCSSKENCGSDRQGKDLIRTLSTSLTTSKDGLVDLRGPLRTGSTLAENLFLEYANGMAGKSLGWGRLDEGRLREIMSIHTAYADLFRRTPYIARVQGSNLLNHILKSLEQAVSGRPVAGSLGKPRDRALILIGHDTNIAHIAGMLNLSWVLQGYQPNDTPPGGALLFELWQDAPSLDYSIRLYYIAQSLDQMRRATPLTLSTPPLIVPITLPGCVVNSARKGCTWSSFQKVVSGAIDSAFVER